LEERVNDQNPSNENRTDENEGSEAEAPEDALTAVEVDPSQPAEPDEQKQERRFLPSTDAGRTRLAAAGIAAAFLLAGGLGGYAIGQANDGPDHPEMSRDGGFDGRGPGGAGRGPASLPGEHPGTQ